MADEYGNSDKTPMQTRKKNIVMIKKAQDLTDPKSRIAYPKNGDSTEQTNANYMNAGEGKKRGILAIKKFK